MRPTTNCEVYVQLIYIELTEVSGEMVVNNDNLLMIKAMKAAQQMYIHKKVLSKAKDFYLATLNSV